MAENKIIFPKGLYFEKKEASPEFVIGAIAIKVVDLIPFLEQYVNKEGYVNIDVLLAKETGKPYCRLNTYTLQPKSPVKEEINNQERLNNIDREVKYPEDDINAEDIPF